MAEVKAFCALRPNEKQAAEVAALPYDVYTREEARAAVQGHPLSFLNIDRPETQFPEDCDMYAQEVYEKARDMLREQTAAGVYVREEKPVYFFYELSVESGVLAPLLKGHSQTGVVACSSVDDYLNQVVRKHENTREEKERDRIRHVDIVDAQTGPIFLTYRGTEALKACEARAKEQGIPLKFWNPLQKGQTITDGDKVYTPDMVLGEARRGLKVSYCTDTRPVPAIAEYAKDADLMICEGMYGEPDKQQKAREHKHMTMQEAAKLAAEAKPKELWLTHYSPSLNYPEEFMEGIRKIFPAAKAAKDGWTMELDFPEEA